MSTGFDNEKSSKKVKVSINEQELDRLIKKYKGLRKYMKSPLYHIRVMDGNEEVVSELLEEYKNNPL